jgi:hypothetical protein
VEFRNERADPVAAERLERRAQTWVIVAMLLVATYVGVEAVRALVAGSHPESSAFGFGIAAISLVVLPALGGEEAASRGITRQPGSSR